MKKSNFVRLASIVLAAGLFWACDESGAGIEVLPEFIDKGGDANGLAVKPAHVILAKGAEQRFTAFSDGKELGSGIKWTLSSGAEGTTLSGDGGLLKVAADETAPALTVTAEVSGKKFTAKADVTVLENAVEAEDHGLKVSPGVVVVGKGYSQTFTAVLSKGGAEADVTWTVTGGVKTAAMTDGVLTVDAAETAAKLIVKAESGALSGTAIVYVDEAPEGTGPYPDNHGIAVDPLAVTLAVGGAQTFTQKGAASVNWTLEGSNASSITDGGALTVTEGETAKTIVVRAAGTGVDSSKYGTAVVTVSGGAGTGGGDGEPGEPSGGGGQKTTLTIGPATAVEQGGRRQFWAKDNGTTLTSGVTWSVSGGGIGTSITSPGGLLTVASTETALSLTVTAEYSGVTQTAYIAVTAPVVSADDPGTGTGNPGRSLKKTFGITTTDTTGVTDTFKAVHDFIANGGLTEGQTVIGLGDYIDLEGGLTVAAYGSTGGYSSGSYNSDNYRGAISITEPGTGIDQTFTTGDGDASTSTGAYFNPNYKGKLLRIIVVGINSFKKYNTDGGYNPDADVKAHNDVDHVVFQFQNTPVSRRMNSTASNTGGYPASEGRRYLVEVGNEGGNFLTGLTNAGVPEAILWGPKRLMGTQYRGTDTQYIDDKLWLPTEWEMFGAQLASDGSTLSETAANQGRLEYYANESTDVYPERVKYNANGPAANGNANTNDAGLYGYWLASPSVYSAPYYFSGVSIKGNSGCGNASLALGFAPAFCVK